MTWFDRLIDDSERVARDPDAPLNVLLPLALNHPELVAGNPSLFLEFSRHPDLAEALAEEQFEQQLAGSSFHGVLDDRAWVPGGVEALRHLAQHPATPGGILTALAGSREEGIAANAFLNPSLPSATRTMFLHRLRTEAHLARAFLTSVGIEGRDALPRLMPEAIVRHWWQKTLNGDGADHNPTWDLLKAGCGSEPLHQEILIALIDQHDLPSAFTGLRPHPNAVRHALAYLAPSDATADKVRHFSILLTLARSPTCPSDVLETLADLALHSSRDNEAWDDLVTELVDHPNLSHDTAARLAERYEKGNVLLLRKDLPKEIGLPFAEAKLEHLANAPLTFFDTFDAANVPGWYADLVVQDDGAGISRKATAYMHEDATCTLLDLGIGTRIGMMNKMGGLPRRDAEPLLTIGGPSERRHAARLTSEPDLLKRAAIDSSPRVRIACAKNPATPFTTRLELAKDTDSDVRSAARTGLAHHWLFPDTPTLTL